MASHQMGLQHPTSYNLTITAIPSEEQPLPEMLSHTKPTPSAPHLEDVGNYSG